MKSCRNCRALKLSPGISFQLFECGINQPTKLITMKEAEYDQRLGKFIDIKPQGACRKVRTLAEMVGKLT